MSISPVDQGPADEAQALLTSTFVERGVVRNGQPQFAEQIFVPAQVYQGIERAAAEEIEIARDFVLDDYPHTAANSVVDRLVRDGALSQEKAKLARDMVELEIRRGIDHLVDRVHLGQAGRLQLAMRSLVPLITTRRMENGQ